ncbi:hypothetical protein IC620_07985 [Hazenella sp. IB182357]|uniref:Uncharacterized protein n=1 Tax=Polycladospora coralii TaxID=2771432 RepID=A0A926N9M9_9BACL|nr:hypothetical protein [Polycladospora coralii]MBD1372293.1 hypothetical protein [Polycladospora coralii]MBS7531517.1 hypothetical protein [Polycladospora coralii]
MAKKTYYVALDMGSPMGQIRESLNENDAVYDFEIEATEKEINQLETLFTEAEDMDFQTFVKANTPYLDNESEENRVEDEKIREIYQLIYQLGTDKTKTAMHRSKIIH